MTKNLARNLEIKCPLSPKDKATLMALREEEKGLIEGDFQCSQAIIDESVKEGYNVTCKKSGKDCPMYPHLLQRADEMPYAEFEAIGSR